MQTLTGYLLIIVVVGTICGALIYKNSVATLELDSGTFCPVAGSPTITAVMLDTTDPLNTIQEATLKNELQKTRDGIPQYGRLEVYPVGSTVEATLPKTFSLCNPGRKENTNRFSGNPRLVEKKWREKFDEPLEKLLAGLKSVQTAPKSPIMQSIQSISVTAFHGPAEEKASHHLIIVSDLLQYGDGLNFYKSVPSFDSFKLSPLYRQLQTDLQNVKVEILWLRRPSQISSTDLIEFWRAYFTAQGATLNRVYTIDG